MKGMMVNGNEDTETKITGSNMETKSKEFDAFRQVDWIISTSKYFDSWNMRLQVR